MIKELAAGLAVALTVLASHAAAETDETASPGEGAQTIASEASFEPPHLLPVAEVLPIDERFGPSYAVGRTVYADGYAQRFTIESPEFGEFTPDNDYMLGVGIAEIVALERLAEIRKSEAYAKAVAKAGLAPAYVLKDLVTRPVSTVTAIPKGIWRSGSKAVRWLGGDRRERAESENSATRELIGFSRRKRALAAELGIDPYSSNIVLQDELDRVAWSSFAGGLTVTVAFAAAALPPAASLTYRVANLTASTNEMVTGMSGGDLYRRNRDSLRELGISEEQTEAFLNNEYLSPSRKTAITLGIERLPGVGGIEKLVAAGIAVEHESDGVRLQRSIELAGAYHQVGAPLARLDPAGGDWLLREQSGTAVALLPADRLLWTERSYQLGEALKDANNSKFAPAIWVSGTFSETARTQLTERGLTLRDRAGDQLESLVAPTVSAEADESSQP